jgi:branched-chain amino acid transport system substrate-binding protein
MIDGYFPLKGLKRMRSAKLKVGIAILAAVALVAACSSSSKKTAGGGSSTPTGSGSASAATFPNGTLTVGLSTPLTGVSAPTYSDAEKGVQMAFDTINAAGGVNGQQLKVVTADDASTPAGALAAAQKLVLQNHVSILLSLTNVSVGAVGFIEQKGIPTLGTANGTQAWFDPKNPEFFDVQGSKDPNAVAPGFGLFAKSQGATTCGALGASDLGTGILNISKANVQSCVDAGLKAGPVIGDVPYGSPDIGPAALQTKNANVDAVYMTQQDTTATSFIEKLTQLGVKLKASLLPTGYTSTTLNDKATNTALQGQSFSVQMTPVEADTAGAKAFKAALVSHGIDGPPSYSAQMCWMTGWQVMAGLKKAAKPNPTSAEFITALRSVKDFNADGAIAPDKIDFSQYNVKYSCLWMVTLKGSVFVPVQGSPFCGTATRDVS